MLPTRFFPVAFLVVLALEARAPAQSPDLSITSFSPPRASYLGRTPFEIRGSGFTSATEVTIDKTQVIPIVVDSTRITGTLPAHAWGPEPVPVRVHDPRGSDDILPDAVTYVGPLRVDEVQPGEVPAGVGGIVKIIGAGFTPTAEVEIGSMKLGERETEFVDATTLRVRAPSLGLGRYNVRVIESSTLGPPISHTLEGGIVYLGQFLPGPQEVETSLAEGTARFTWSNPVDYELIEVLDADGEVLMQLPRGTRSLELPASGLTEVDIELRGVVQERPTGATRAIAKLLLCTPQPLAGAATPGDLDLSLRGGHEPAEVARCAPDPAGGGGVVVNLEAGPVSVSGLGSSGPVMSPNGSGYVYQDWQASLFGAPNSWTTGFVLEEEATVLEIAGFYEKIAPFPGLSLRGRITQVASPEDPHIEDGFTDEFIFPDITTNKGKEWHWVNYFRADKDVSHVPDPDDPNDAAPEPCRDENQEIRKLPRGEYLLEVYAVGGDPREQYYSFADDSRPHELLIPGAPCPPYPLIRVRDMTGRRTLPVIQRIDTFTLWANPKPFVRFQAIGSWLDETGQPHPIGPEPEGEPDNPDFEYVWTIQQRGGPLPAKSSGSSSSLATEVEDWGCYYIDLKVKDKACPRSVTRSYQVAVTPETVQCQSGNQYFSFLFPTPEPSGIAALVGLDPPPGLGKFDNKRPVEFVVLVAPKYYCEQHDGNAVFLDDVEFTLARPMIGGGHLPLQGVGIEITDLCPDVVEGLKYLHVRIDDLGKIAEIPGADGTEFRNVYFVGRTKFYYDPVSGTDNYTVRKAVSDAWHRIGPPLRLANRPPMLETSYWSGHFDELEAAYHFSVQASSESRKHFPIGDSNEIPLPIDDAPIPIEIPSFSNDLTTGFNARFKVVQEEYLSEAGTGGAFGDTLGNKIEGQPLQIDEGFPGGGGGGSLDYPEYHWEKCTTLFQQSLRQTLFESILFTGSIGPVPVTVWASIALGIDMVLKSETVVDVRPFAALEGSGEPSVSSHFYLYGTLGLSVPCEIRADVLFGVASLAARLIPQATIEMKAHVGVEDAQPQTGALLDAGFSLLFEVEACIWALIDEICYTIGPEPILEDEPIINFSVGDGGSGATDCQETLAISPGGAGEGAGVDQTFRTLATSRPGVAVSPNGDTTLYLHAVEAPEGSFGNTRTLGVFSANDQAVFNVALAIHDVIDPAPAFVTNTRALVGWTRGQSPAEPIAGVGITARNTVAALQDILVTPIQTSGSGSTHGGEPTFFRVSDVPGEVAPADRRADGMAAVGADPSPAAVQAGGEALVAWVRYDGPFLVQDGTQTRIYQRTLVNSEMRLVPQNVDTVRPNLERTTIHARRVGANGPIGPAAMISPPGLGINVEPTLAVSPSGNTAYCVWVHDSYVDPVSGERHVNLIDSNLGRNLMVSVYSKSTGAWSAPVNILADPDRYPALLEPNIALRDDHDGLLAFTALGEGAVELDTGLSNNRHVFACRLTAGAFGEPVLIHGECLTPENGHWPQVAWSSGTFPDVDVQSQGADYIITYHGTGPSGSRAGAGNVMLTALGTGMDRWIPPVNLTDDDEMHSNIAAAVSPTGDLLTFHLNGGPAGPGLSGGGLAGLASARGMKAARTTLAPDPVVAGCQLSDPFPAPGSQVIATVEIANRGLAGTALDQLSRSLLGVAAVYAGDDGRERKVAESRLPELQPGETFTVKLPLEMPHDPVTLRIVLEAGPLDRDTANNSLELFLGAPAPRDLACDFDFYALGEEGEERPVARLRWKNPAVYEEVRVYRDGSMLAALPGSATFFVDTYAAPGLHTYEVRGIAGVSSSRRASCEVKLPEEPPPEGLFRRGDVDGNGSLQITDAISLLGFLFLGSDAPECADAADADDNGELQITDSIRVLGFLFLGSDAPPAPGPGLCGPDPTADALEPCGGECQ